MKAALYDRFGGPDVLRIGDASDPVLQPDGVLVRVVASGVNPVDVKARAGRLASRFPFEFPVIPGWDLAGEVHAVGPAIDGLRPGDPVAGYARLDWVSRGTAAEAIAVPVRTLARLPSGLDPLDAAAVASPSVTALQALRLAELGPGSRLLVVGAGSLVGRLAVQLARARGVEVDAVAGVRHHGELAALGARTLDRAEPIAGLGAVNASFEVFGGDRAAEARRLVAGDGRIVTLVDRDQPRSDARVRYLFARPDAGDLADGLRLAASGGLRLPALRPFALDRIADAHRAAEDDAVTEKIVLTV